MTLMTLTGTSAFALVSGATTAAGSFSGNDPAHQDAGGVHDCASRATSPGSTRRGLAGHARH